MTQADFRHFSSCLEALSPEQLRQLRERLDGRLARPKAPRAKSSGRPAEHTKAAPRLAKKPLTEAALRRHMLQIGLMSQLPGTAAEFDDPDDQPIAIDGVPLSETIIRERR